MMAIGTLLTVSAAATPSVYPTPQVAEWQTGVTRVKRVVLKTRQMNSREGLWQKLPADKEGGYALQITPGKLEVCANDNDGVYYAKQTIAQLLRNTPQALNAQEDPFADMSLEQVAQRGELPLGCIVDWPDIANRGVVEGYYGTPWSFEARKSMFRFMGRNKMNVYIYAPKDDPYHHGAGCYKPYPENKAAELRDLVQHARRNHVRFVWAIHPANTVRWADQGGRPQLDALCKKLESLYDLGVRDFGVFVDDSSGEIGQAARQAELCNYLLENFVRRHPDVAQNLIMCPTGYNRSWTNAKFLQDLGAGLHKDIMVMWTGDTVVNNITLPGQTWVSSQLNRPTFIWWNWPCSDFKRSRLSMGRTYGLGQEEQMKELLSGFVANPMEQAEANKVGLFGVADYTWNIAAFDSDRSWREGVRRLYAQDREAMQVFCDHNSYLLPNNHGYYREESVEMAPVVERFISSLEAAAPDAEAAASLSAEFARMEKAGKQLMESTAMPELKQEILPWFTQFAGTGYAGVKVLAALNEQDATHRLELFFDVLDRLVQMRRTTRPEWNGGNIKPVEDVEVAMFAMTPALIKAFRYINRSIYARLAGRSTVQPTFSTNNGEPAKYQAIVEDDNPRTFWSNGRRQRVGDWYCLDFGSPIDIRRINLLMGGRRANDYAQSGQFELSNDGEHWQPVGDECNGPDAVLNISRTPARARMVRFRITKPRENWLSICEFTVNRIVPPFVTNNLATPRNLSASKTDKVVSVNRVMEVFPINPGEYISLEIPALIMPEWLELNLENANLMKWGKVELTLEDGSTVPVQGEVTKNRLYVKAENLPAQPVCALRVTNVSDETQDIKVTLFRLGVAQTNSPQSADVLTDSDLSTFISCDEKPLSVQLTVPADMKEIVIVGTADCEVEGATFRSRSAHLSYYTLNADCKQLRISAKPQKGTFVSEVIFK